MTWEQKREESYGYLEKYKDDIAPKAYERIRQTIGSQAIEDMFTTEDGVKRLIMIENGEATADELITEYLKNLRVS